MLKIRMVELWFELNRINSNLLENEVILLFKWNFVYAVSIYYYKRNI